MNPDNAIDGNFTMPLREWQQPVPAILLADAETARRIVAAATALFAEQGYLETSIQDIADRASTSRGSIFHYVKSKYDLLKSVAVQHYWAHQTFVQVLNQQETPPGIESIGTFISQYLSYVVRDSPRVNIIDREWQALRGPDREEILAMVELQRIYLRKQILVARENGQMTMSGSPGVLTSAIVGMLLWSHNWFRLDGDLDVSSVSNSMVDLVMFGLVTRTPEPLFNPQ